MVGVARTEGPLKEFKQKYGDKFEYVVGDVNESSEEIINFTINKFNRIDSIIANAGIIDPVKSIEFTDIEAWKRLFDINFFSIVSLTSLAIPYLRASKGKLVVVSSGASQSGASQSGASGWGAYGASKAAVNHFVLQLSAEEPEISAVAIAPGTVDTEMQTEIRNVHGKNMTKEGLQRFIDLKENNLLLDPLIPATLLSNLATRGFSSEINGKYLRYNNELLKSFLS